MNEPLAHRPAAARARAAAREAGLTVADRTLKAWLDGRRSPSAKHLRNTEIAYLQVRRHNVARYLARPSQPRRRPGPTTTARPSTTPGSTKPSWTSAPSGAGTHTSPPTASRPDLRHEWILFLWATRKALREVIRADPPAAHFGLGIVVVASVSVGYFSTPVAGALIAGAFTALFIAALAVMFLRGIRGADAWRRAYLLAFGWANWI